MLRADGRTFGCVVSKLRLLQGPGLPQHLARKVLHPGSDGCERRGARQLRHHLGTIYFFFLPPIFRGAHPSAIPHAPCDVRYFVAMRYWMLIGACIRRDAPVQFNPKIK